MKRRQRITPEQRRALAQAERNLRMREAAKKRAGDKSIFDEIENDRLYCLDDWRTASRIPLFGKFPRDDEEVCNA